MDKLLTHRLAEENIGLVHLCANRFRSRGIEYDDLYGAGCVGLMKACHAFDSQRGVKFSTYAVPVILGEIKRLFRDGGAVKVSRSVKENSLRLTRLRENFIKTEGREPTIDELGEISGLDREEVVVALNVSMPPVSLTGGDEENGAEFDIPTAAPDEEIMNALAVKQLLFQLEAKDRRLIYLRYFRNKTQTEAAEILGMTQVQVSRREKKLLSAMRQRLQE